MGGGGFQIFTFPNGRGSLVQAWALKNVSFHSAQSPCPIGWGNDNIQNELVQDCVQVFDDTFADLTEQGNRPTVAAAQVHTYFTEYFCSVCRAVDWQNEG